MPGQRPVQPLGQPAGGERRGVDPVHRRVQLDLDGQLLRRAAADRGPRVQAAGQPVAEHGVGPEPGGHVRRIERPERAQAAQPEPAQQPDQLGPVDVGIAVELLHAERGQEGRGVPRRDGQPPARREHGREQPVGHPHLALHPGARRDLVDQPLGGGQLTAEVAGRPPGRQRDQAGPDDLHPGGQLLDRHHHRLERAGVPIRVAGEHGQLRAAGLGLPAAQPAPDPLRAGHRRAGQHPVGHDHRRRPVRRDVRGAGGRGDRPVRRPQRQHPHRPGSSRHAHHAGSRADGAGAAAGRCSRHPGRHPDRRPLRFRDPGRDPATGGGQQQPGVQPARRHPPPVQPHPQRAGSAAARSPPSSRRRARATAPRRSSARDRRPASGPATRSTAPRCRARAASRCRSAARIPARSAPATTTTSSPSSSAEVTASRSAPGRGTRASRSSRRPASAAATSPSSGRPTTPTQAPPADASASKASSNEVAPGPTGHGHRGPPAQAAGRAATGPAVRPPAAPGRRPATGPGPAARRPVLEAAQQPPGQLPAGRRIGPRPVAHGRSSHQHASPGIRAVGRAASSNVCSILAAGVRRSSTPGGHRHPRGFSARSGGSR